MQTFIIKEWCFTSKNWGMSEVQVWIEVFSKDNIEECEHVTKRIGELSCSIDGFSMTEITDILAYIYTNEL